MRKSIPTPASRLSPQQRRLAGDQRSPFRLLRLLQLQIIVAPGLAPYRGVSRRRLVGDHFKSGGPNLASFHDGRAAERAVSRRVLVADCPQRVTRLASVTENRRFAVARRR
jgi:hypothetical protein